MAKLYGQNFRILTYDPVEAKYRVVGMATSASVTLNANTDDASHKDILGMAAMPTVTSLSWQVSVESLNVVDAPAVLNAIKSMQPFTLIWDEVSTADNQTALKAGFARRGLAYLNDATFNWNDRENSTKSLQFQGIGELEKLTQTPTVDIIPIGNLTKGETVRLFLGSDNTAAPAKVIASSRQLSMHVSLSLEDSTTKDTSGSWAVQEPTGLSYDISTTALVRSGDTITSAVQGQSLANLQDIYEAQSPVKFQIANVSGHNNRTKGTVIVEGSVIVSNLQINMPNRQSSDYTAQMNGYGNFTVGEDPAES